MVQYLVDVTGSLIKVRSSAYPSPPPSPTDAPVTLFEFIRRLIKHSNVQTPTLMSTLVYLARLKTILPSNVYGLKTTRHRIFLGCLILAAKTLNDSSPINKHWAAYTDGLLSISEVNTLERELLEYLDWDLTMTNNDLICALSHFLTPIKHELKKKQQEQIIQRQKVYFSGAHTQATTRLSSLLTPSPSTEAVTSSSSMHSMSSVPSLMSASSSRTTLSSISSLSNSSLSHYTVEPLQHKNMNIETDIKRPASSFNSLVNAGTVRI